MKVRPLTERKAVKILFIIALIALPLHYIVILWQGEPWPAVVLPSFRKVPADSGRHVTFQKPQITVYFTDSSVASVSRSQFLKQARPSFRSSIMNKNFRPLDPAFHKSGGKELRTEADAVARARLPEAVEWIRRRLSVLYPNKTPVQLRVVWKETTYEGGEKGFSITSVEPTDTLNIRLQ